MSKQIKLEIARENPEARCWIYSDLQLPAEKHELNDALQRARITEQNTPYEISVYECEALPLLPFRRLDSPTIDEMNFLAKRLDGLNEEERLVLQAVASKVLKYGEDEIVSVKDLINLTYGLDEVSIISNISNPYELGKFTIENDLNSDVESIPEDAVYLLDKEKIGRLQQKNDNGVFVNGKYIIAGEYALREVYDGKNLPLSAEEDMSDYMFKLEVTKPPEGDNLNELESMAKWLTLPCERAKADELANKLGLNKIEDGVYIGFNSTVPQIDADNFGDMHNFDKLNSLSELMLQLTPSDQVKFKAVLSAEEPENIDKIFDVARNLEQYEFAPMIVDESHFFKSYLARHLDKNFDERWLDNIVVGCSASELLENLGGTVTDYGVVSARGGHLYNLTPRYESEVITEPTEENEEPDEEPTEQEIGGN